MSSNKPQQRQNGEQQTVESVGTFFRTFLQDVICFVVLLTLGLMILSLFFFVIEDLSSDVKPQAKKNCRWPSEWCEMIWYCRRNQTELELHRTAQQPRLALERANARSELANNYEVAMNSLV